LPPVHAGGATAAPELGLFNYSPKFSPALPTESAITCAGLAREISKTLITKEN
jgi:hypothetical protein